MMNEYAIIHQTAEVSLKAKLGDSTWGGYLMHIREGVTIGKNFITGKHVYIDFGVKIGDTVKIQNSALVYHDAAIEDGIFIDPQVCLTNVRMPRAITLDGYLI